MKKDNSGKENLKKDKSEEETSEREQFWKGNKYDLVKSETKTVLKRNNRKKDNSEKEGLERTILKKVKISEKTTLEITSLHNRTWTVKTVSTSDLNSGKNSRTWIQSTGPIRTWMVNSQQNGPGPSQQI